jgi:hypothetical protein
VLWTEPPTASERTEFVVATPPWRGVYCTHTGPSAVPTGTVAFICVGDSPVKFAALGALFGSEKKTPVTLYKPSVFSVTFYPTIADAWRKRN